MAERETEVEAGLRGDVEFVVRHVVAEHVAAVVGEPQLARHRMPGEPDAVAHTFCEDLRAGTIGLHSDDRGRHRRRRADVARRTDRHVQHVVRAEGDVLPGVAGVRVRQVGADRDRRGRRVEVLFDVVEPQQPTPASPRTARRFASRRRWVGRDRWQSTPLGPPCDPRSRSTTAWTLPGYCDPTNTVPCGPSTIERALSTCSAKTSARNPAGSVKAATEKAAPGAPDAPRVSGRQPAHRTKAQRRTKRVQESSSSVPICKCGAACRQVPRSGSPVLLGVSVGPVKDFPLPIPPVNQCLSTSE